MESRGETDSKAGFITLVDSRWTPQLNQESQSALQIEEFLQTKIAEVEQT